MTLTHLIICGTFGGLVGFIAGWWRGRRDLESDVDDACGELLEKLQTVRTVCACGEPFVARCPRGLECPSIGGDA